MLPVLLGPLKHRKFLVVLAAWTTAAVVLIRWKAGSRIRNLSLEELMNGGVSQPPLVKSSFDWSSVEYRFPEKQMIPLPSGPPKVLPTVQHNFHAKPENAELVDVRETRRVAIRMVTRKAWNSYRKHAWKKDSLMPISARGVDQFAGWSATLVDSLDTLWIMGFRKEFDEAVAAAAELDFGKAFQDRVNTFEITIRILGGLLAAYDLSKRQVLLQKAVELGDFIYAGFNTPNRMPADFIDFELAKIGSGLTVEDSVVSAAPASLCLELTRLSQLTGDPKYYSAISHITDVYYNGMNATSIPGLFPLMVSMSRQDVVAGDGFTFGGGADSLYEYFPKMHALLGGRENKYIDLTKAFIQAGKKHVFYRPMTPNKTDLLISGTVNMLDGQPVLDHETEHLACFMGGTVALAARLLGLPDDFEVGEKLARGCAYAYKMFPLGIMPERISMAPCQKLVHNECRWDAVVWQAEKAKKAKWSPHLPMGIITANDPRYILRPEAIESVFYMWRLTGNQEWQDMAWDMWMSIAVVTRTPYANAAIKDVTRPRAERSPVEQDDYMESFWIAETLKYFYLIFSPTDLISLDEYVFNTEAHPFLRPT